MGETIIEIADTRYAVTGNYDVFQLAPLGVRSRIDPFHAATVVRVADLEAECARLRVELQKARDLVNVDVWDRDELAALIAAPAPTEEPSHV